MWVAMLGWYYADAGQIDRASQCLAWLAERFDSNGWLAEQYRDQLQQPETFQPWVQRWGEPANPLLWSHAMFITLATELSAA